MAFLREALKRNVQLINQSVNLEFFATTASIKRLRALDLRATDVCASEPSSVAGREGCMKQSANLLRI